MGYYPFPRGTHDEKAFLELREKVVTFEIGKYLSTKSKELINTALCWIYTEAGWDFWYDVYSNPLTLENHAILMEFFKIDSSPLDIKDYL